MQILFHKDFFTESLQDVSLKGQCQNLFDKCREKNIEGWILATSVPEIIKTLQKVNLVNVFKEWLDILTILPLTGNELRDGLKEADNYEHYLIKQAISSFRLKAVLTAHPDTLKTNGIAAVGCSNFEEDISKFLSPVNSVPLVNVPATHHDLWNDVEDQMAGVVRSGMFILGPKVAELEEQRMNSLLRSAPAKGADLLKQLMSAARMRGPAEHASVELALGDWYLWCGSKQRSSEAYAAVVAELQGAGESGLLEEWLGTPVELPDNGVFWVPQLIGVDEGPVVRASYDVSSRGRLSQLQTTLISGSEDTSLNSFRRKLSAVLFRPRWVNGEPEAVTGLQRDYQILN